MKKITKEIVMFYFKKSNQSEDKWVCKCGKVLIQRKGTGNTNLKNHIRSQHPNYLSMSTLIKPLDNFVVFNSYSQKCNIMYGWIEQVCIGLKPFNFVEDPIIRKYSKLESISINILKK